MSELWTTEGFDAFRRGTFGNGGHNIYVSKAGVLQRIHRTSVHDSGYADLVFCNSQNHEELVPMDVYPDPINHPEIKWQLQDAAACDAVVADFTGNGSEDMAWAFLWDGMQWLQNSVLYYMGEKGPSDQYINYLPANKSKAVAAGDFNGDGRNDIAYLLDESILIFCQDELGFNAHVKTTIPIDDASNMAGYKYPGDELATLFIRKKDGSIWALKEFCDNAVPTQVLPADEDFVRVEHAWDNYNQAVEATQPKLRVVHFNDKCWLTVFRKNYLALYPLEEKGLGVPMRIECRAGMAAECADLFNRGCIDLIIASRDQDEHRQFSYLYPGKKEGGFDCENRIPIRTLWASDVCVGNLSGGKGKDFVISQTHTLDHFENDILIFATGTMTSPAVPQPKKVLGHAVERSVIVHDKTGKGYLVVGNKASGSFIGDPDNYIYLGSASGFHEHDVIQVPGFGSVDMICADLNDDGRADLAFADAWEIDTWFDTGSHIHFQKPDGTFGREPQALRTYRGHGVATGDFNHNGYLDLVFSGFANNVITVFNGGPEGFSNDNCYTIELEDEDGVKYTSPLFIIVADLNGNGYLDLILPCGGKEKSFVLWGGPDGFSFKNRQAFRVFSPVKAEVADLNGDGYPELIFAGHAQRPGQPWEINLHIYWGGPDGFSETRKTLLPCNGCNSLNIADFNNDGLLDIFVGAYEDNYDRDIPSYIYWNSPQGFSRRNRTKLQTHAVSGSIAADFNDDGYIDLAVGNHKVYGKHICKSTVWYNGPEGFCEKNTVDLPTFGVHGMGSVDVGNILDRSFNEYYISEPHEIPKGCGISEIWWDADIPHKCDVTAHFRCADTLEELEKTPWGTPGTNCTGYKAHNRIEKERFCGKYMQYRLALFAHNGVSSPRIRSVTVKFEPYNFN